ncbi:MAG: CIA30 family protein [Candidatus Longimicrobiales bacterium M2_2A_002]
MRDIVDFTGPDLEAGSWSVVNDGVMGGRSTSRVERTERGTLRFSGHVSLENNGGFASTRTDAVPLDLSSFRGAAIRVRGDGRRYQLRFRMSGRWSRIWYKAPFDTVDDDWLEVRRAFTDFEPTFRGRRPPDAPPFDPSAIRQVGFLIADEREGPFELEVDWIRAYQGGD